LVKAVVMSAPFQQRIKLEPESSITAQNLSSQQ